MMEDPVNAELTTQYEVNPITEEQEASVFREVPRQNIPLTSIPLGESVTLRGMENMDARFRKLEWYVCGSR